MNDRVSLLMQGIAASPDFIILQEQVIVQDIYASGLTETFHRFFLFVPRVLNSRNGMNPCKDCKYKTVDRCWFYGTIKPGLLSKKIIWGCEKYRPWKTQIQ